MTIRQLLARGEDSSSNEMGHVIVRYHGEFYTRGLGADAKSAMLTRCVCGEHRASTPKSQVAAGVCGTGCDTLLGLRRASARRSGGRSAGGGGGVRWASSISRRGWLRTRRATRVAARNAARELAASWTRAGCEWTTLERCSSGGGRAGAARAASRELTESTTHPLTHPLTHSLTPRDRS